MKRTLITGASGFVGANLARRLLRDGHEIHLMVRESHQSWRIKEIESHVRLHEVDVHDREGVRRAAGAIKPDWVFHLAAYGAYSSQTGIDRMVATNLTGSINVLDACVEIGVEAFVQTGSSSEYGYKDHAAVETELVQPNSHYAITKAAATHYCQFIARQSNIHAVTVRLYSIYGPYEDPGRLVPTAIVYGLEGRLPPLVSPTTARDFVYVDDCVEGLLRAASHPEIPRGSIYNLCSGSQSTLAELVTEVCAQLNISAEPQWSSMPPRSWDSDVWVGSPAAMERAIGWRARVELRAGIGRLTQWFREHPEWLSFYRSRIFQEPS